MCSHKLATKIRHLIRAFIFLLSAAEDLGITRVVLLVGFFVWSLPYQLPPSCYPIFLNYHYLSINPSSSILSINQSVPFPKYQYIIAADPVLVLFALKFLPIHSLFFCSDCQISLPRNPNEDSWSFKKHMQGKYFYYYKVVLSLKPKTEAPLTKREIGEC